jgi:hypothetical protein
MGVYYEVCGGCSKGMQTNWMHQCGKCNQFICHRHLADGVVSEEDETTGELLPLKNCPFCEKVSDSKEIESSIINCCKKKDMKKVERLLKQYVDSLMKTITDVDPDSIP